MADFSRRTVIKATGAIGAAVVSTGLSPELAAAQGRDTAAAAMRTAATAAPHAASSSESQTYLFLNGEEAAFIEAAVARLIPADNEWPGGVEAGVPNYIDKQLAGAWGAGERLYRSGPWRPGTPSQGYQLPFTPAELFRAALGAIAAELAQAGTPFAEMSTEQQDAYLHGLEKGGRDLRGVPSDIFFSHLLDATIEGFFSDPVYGGNRDMVAWRMIGFPGAYAYYYDLVDQHGIKVDRPPLSLAEDEQAHIHMHPDIPAHLP
jgi:gluconate 2-dehydrogenase gamma chain